MDQQKTTEAFTDALDLIGKCMEFLEVSAVYGIDQDDLDKLLDCVVIFERKWRRNEKT